jgi:hypothetical protein
MTPTQVARRLIWDQKQAAAWVSTGLRVAPAGAGVSRSNEQGTTGLIRTRWSRRASFQSRSSTGVT